jgi:hypothetical protein
MKLAILWGLVLIAWTGAFVGYFVGYGAAKETMQILGKCNGD